MKRLTLSFAIGLVLGAAAAWSLAARGAPGGERPTVLEEQGERHDGADRSNSAAAGNEPAVRGASVPPTPRVRPLYDLLPATTGGGVPSESVRDELWAAAMEPIVVGHAKAKLLEFIPGATWDGVTCMTRTCTMYFRVADDDSQLAEVVANFMAGTRFRYGTQPADEGRVEFSVTAEYRDRGTDERLSPDGFLEMQAHRAPETVEWEARTKANIDKLKAELRSQR